MMCLTCGAPTGNLLLSGSMWVHVGGFMNKCSIMFHIGVFLCCMGFFLTKSSQCMGLGAANLVSLLNHHGGRTILLMVRKARYMHIRVKVALAQQMCTYRYLFTAMFIF